MKKEDLPQATLERLPLYHRTLQQLESRGFETVSSQQFAGFLNIKAETLRKDLAACGNFGVRSVGYYVAELRERLENFLGLNYHRKIGIVGAGNLGLALAVEESFIELGFEVAAIFDKDESLFGEEIGDVKIYDFAKIESIAQRKMIDIGVITVTKDAAQEAADALVKAGVSGIWNFAPIRLFVPANVQVVDADLSFSLSVLNYYVTEAERSKDKFKR